jgi:hypothetical protein
VVRSAVLNLLREELGFPVIAWEPSPELDDLNLTPLNLQSVGARALVPEKLDAGGENSSDIGGREEIGVLLAEGEGEVGIGGEDGIGSGSSGDQVVLGGDSVATSDDVSLGGSDVISDDDVESMRQVAARKRDPAQELMAEAITTIAGHNEVEVNSLLVHGLGKPGVMKPVDGWGYGDLGSVNGEAAQQAKEELTDALLRSVNRMENAEPSSPASMMEEGSSGKDGAYVSGLEGIEAALFGGVQPESSEFVLEGSENRYSPDGAWSSGLWASEEEFSEDEDEGSSNRPRGEWSSENLPEGFQHMPPELRERQLQRLKDAERWRQLEEELYYLGPYGQRLLYTRRKLKNQGRIVVPKDALLAWVQGKRKHGRQRRGRVTRQTSTS